MDFQYELAFAEVAKPKFQELPGHIKDLIDLVARDAKDLHQEKNLDMPYPESSNLKEAFAKLTDDELAKASHTVFFYGHWCSAKENALVRIQENGTYWKFAKYADQELRLRLNIPESNSTKNGISFKILEGVIRVCWSHKDGWTWREFGWATKELWDSAMRAASLTVLEKEVVYKYYPRDDYTRACLAFNKYARTLKDACGKVDPLWDLSKYGG